jgi:hypothetical protein
MLDYRAQVRKIAELEMRGFTRRSAADSAQSAQQAEEAARLQTEEEA